MRKKVFFISTIDFDLLQDVNILNSGEISESAEELNLSSGRQSSMKSTFDFGERKSTRNDSWFRPETSSDKPQTGSVKRWNEDRGFGFIRQSRGGPDLFCHARSLKDGLEKLEEVNYSMFVRSSNFSFGIDRIRKK